MFRALRASNIISVFVLLFGLASLVYLPNIGGSGLFIPSNSLVWISISIITLISILNIRNKDFIYLPKYWFLIAISIAFLCIPSVLFGVKDPVDWAVRFFAIIISFLFFLALFQFSYRKLNLDSALYVLLVILSIHSIVGALQMLPFRLIGLYPFLGDGRAIGIFQQPNLLASSLATTIAISLYFIFSSSLKNKSFYYKLLPFSLLIVCSFLLGAIGSRIGLISVFLSVSLIFYSRFFLFKDRVSRVFIPVFFLVMGFSLAFIFTDGGLHAHSKIERLAESGQDVRVHIYKVGFDVMLKKPILGYGFGGFKSAFHEEGGVYQAGLGENKLGFSRYTHPHNEFIFLGIEAGILGIASLLLFIAYIVLHCFRLGFRSGLVLISMVIPILLHMQVEYPLYISTFHWVLLIFLAYYISSLSSDHYEVSLSIFAFNFYRFFSLVVVVVVVVFCSTSFYYSILIDKTIYSENGKMEDLVSISSHPYFSDFAMSHIYVSASMNERVHGGTLKTTEYAKWLEIYLEKDPDVSAFIDLIKAYGYLERYEEANVVIERALYLYPSQPQLLELKNFLNMHN